MKPISVALALISACAEDERKLTGAAAQAADGAVPTTVAATAPK
jgi:hypothetical protein